MDGYLIRLFDETGEPVSPWAEFLTKPEMLERYPYLEGLLSLADLETFSFMLSAGVSMSCSRCKVDWDTPVK